MKLIVGLGNPGTTYQQTRHNIGFIMIDKLLSEFKTSIKVQSKFEAATAEFIHSSEKVILVKPLTFMNLSGNAVSKLVQFYKIPIENILIVSDDMDLPLGKIRMRESGSHGGQNGLRNIIEHFGTNFKRMRIGIGKSELTDKADYVLGKLSKAELDVLMPTFDKAYFAIKEWIETNDFNKVMTKYNTPQAV